MSDHGGEYRVEAVCRPPVAASSSGDHFLQVVDEFSCGFWGNRGLYYYSLQYFDVSAELCGVVVRNKIAWKMSWAGFYLRR